MARRGAVNDLPPSVKAWLDRALTEDNFSGYQRLERALKDRGFAISKSAIHRYGQTLERRLAAIRASTEAAKLIADASPDDKDVRSEALTALIQSELFETIINLQEASDEKIDPAERVKLLSSAAKNIATLTRSSVNLKKFQAEVRREAALAATAMVDKAERAATKAGEKGLSAERIAQLRRDIAGMA